MKKSNFICMYFMLLSVIILPLSSCQNESSVTTQRDKTETVAVEKLKNDLENFNVEYVMKYQDTRKFPPAWLRKTICAIVDIGAFIYTRSITDATAASAMINDGLNKDREVMIGKDKIAGDSTTTEIGMDYNEDALSGIEPGTVGYTHNKVIISSYRKADIEGKNGKHSDFNKIVATEVEMETGQKPTNVGYEIAQETLNEIRNSPNKDIAISIFFNKLKSKTDDAQIKDALDVCSTVLEGLRCVDNNDTSYIATVKNKIETAEIPQELKTKMLDGINLSDASMKLWNPEKKKKP